MFDAPKIVHDRLRATVPREAHPEADVLTAFAEQALSGAEREGVLRHLARCGDCREVVALSLPPLEEVTQPRMAAEQASPRRPSDRSRSWIAWPNLRWAALAAGVVVVGSVLLLRPEKPTESKLGTEDLAAQGNAQPPLPEARSNSAAPSATEPARSIGARSAKPDRGLMAEKRTADRDQAAPEFSRAPSAAGTSGQLGGTQLRDSLETKASKSIDSGKLATQVPASPAAAPAEIAGPVRAITSSQQVVVNGAAVEVQSAPVQGTLVARNDSPVAPIAKAKPAAKEEAGLKSQLQESDKKANLMYSVSGSALARQKQLSKTSKDVAAAQWSLAQGKLLRSLDAGMTWESALQPQQPLLSFGAHGNDVWAGGQNGTLFHSIDAGTTWTMIQPSTKSESLTGDIVSIDIRSAIEIAVSTSTSESWTTADGGKTWDKK